jgi:GT2 family glycosyltransferase
MAEPSTPNVSVILVNYNGLRHLDSCLSSLRDLDYPQDKLEIVLVDNASSDNSVDFVRDRFPEVKIVVNATNTGFALGNNIGVKEAGGEYVALLNNDMKADKSWLRALVEAVAGSPTVVCAGSKILDWDGKAIDFAGSQLNFYGHGFQVGFSSPDIAAYDKPGPIPFACGGAMLVRRDVFLDVGGFDEDYFAFFEDVDLGWRLWLLGYEVVFTPASVTYHRHHGTAASVADEKKQVLYERNALYTLIKNYDDANLARVLPAALLLAIKRATIYLGLGDAGKYRIGPAPKVAGLAEPYEPVDANAMSRWARIKQEEGSTAAAAKRVLAGVWPRLTGFVMRIVFGSNKKLEVVSRMGVADILALNDIADLMPRIMEKRAELQLKRKRPDQEIFKLFGDPMRPSFPNEEFIANQRAMEEAFNLRDVFGADS